jgi:spore germination cell wall hydrolase CwlJ-like protein
LFRTRAVTLALLVSVCVFSGLICGAVAFAGAVNSPTAQAYAAAAKAGYVNAAASRAPATHGASPAQTVATVTVTAPRAARGSLNCLAEAVYYEARGESAEGRAAVAQVVMNRTHRAGYPRSVCGVVYQGAADGDCQFSFVCNGAMHGSREQAAWLDARRIAARALAGHVMAEVGKATSFHAVVEGQDGAESGGVRLGRHLFRAS